MNHSHFRQIVIRMFSMPLFLTIALGAGLSAKAERPDPDKLAGKPADIASSAYQYRADRKPDQNQPESWLALMQYANQPLNKPVDVNAPAIKQALVGLLWEEIRPVKTLELTWAADAKHGPPPKNWPSPC